MAEAVLDGVAGTHIQTTKLSTLDEITIEARIKQDNWASGSMDGGVILSQFTGSADERGIIFQCTSGSLLQFVWSTDGTGATQVIETSSRIDLGLSPTNGEYISVKVVFVPDNGSGGYDWAFYGRISDEDPWTSLSGTTRPGTTSVHDADNPMFIGAHWVDGTANPLDAAVRYVRAYDSDGGNQILGFSADDASRNGVAGFSVPDEVRDDIFWTLGGNAIITGVTHKRQGLSFGVGVG